MPNNYSEKDAIYYNSDRSLLISHFPPNVRALLDIGCAEGNFGAEIKQRFGAEVWGVEPFKHAAEIASQKLDKVYSTSIEQALAELPSGYFDCISFNDVLEHLLDPWTMLHKVAVHLKPNGTIFASIPNVMFHEVLAELLFEGDWKYRSAGVLDQTHLRFFTRKSIVRMFSECGYNVTYIEGLPPGTKNQKLHYLNRFIFRGSLNDMKFIQFAVRAQPS